jgi:uncharacterized protein
MIWIHVAAVLLMIAADVAWWVVAMRVTKRRWLRVLASIFLAVQLVSVTVELLDRVGMDDIDLNLYLPTALVAMTVIWHYLGLPAFLCLASVYVCKALVSRRSSRAAAPNPPAASLPVDAVTRRDFIGACASFAPPLLAFGLTGMALGQLNHFRVRRLALSIPSLPRALDGLTIAHITDVHIGIWTHGQILRDMVNTTNNLRPDLVLVTGDLINYELSELSEAMALVKEMPGRYGVWMVEGNHDLLENGVEFERRVKASGIPLLLDESAIGTVRGYPVQFFGLRWMEAFGKERDEVTALQLRGLMEHRQPDAFPILLAHHPHAFDAAVAAGLPLTLTGHTHGGQLMLDHQLGVGPALFRYWSGIYQRKDSQLIVSNGIGNMFPLRLNAPAEIVHLTLHCA